MSAVVGILNKSAVAIAADSAVTLHNGKIFNKANKIFSLSKYHPVGIMLHNIDSFMGIPWETIIKMYRQQLKTTSFDTLQEYQNDFIEFLRNKRFFCSEDHQAYQLNVFFVGINDYFIGQINNVLDQNDPDYLEKFQSELRIKLQSHIDFYSINPEILPDFVGFTYDDFDTYVEPKVQEIFEHSFVSNGHIIDDSIKVLLKQAYFSELIVKEYNTRAYTGLVFAGFGEAELFPSVISMNVYFGFDNKLRYYINPESGAVITHEIPSAICPFAQSDVMLTILTGVAPALQAAYNFNFKDFIGGYNQIILDNFSNDNKELKEVLDRIDKDRITQKLMDIIDNVIQTKYVNPLYVAVSGLSKEDLAEMAESLIYLTYLQRRITNAAESVGGPVDVAVLSKGDGFIWIKRKHYFKPELNSNFFKGYFV